MPLEWLGWLTSCLMSHKSPQHGALALVLVSKWGFSYPHVPRLVGKPALGWVEPSRRAPHELASPVLPGVVMECHLHPVSTDLWCV